MDGLPQISVVFIFVNEALSVILRSVHSLVNHTPSPLLKEVILVDDNSDNGERASGVPGGGEAAGGCPPSQAPAEVGADRAGPTPPCPELSLPPPGVP